MFIGRTRELDTLNKLYDSDKFEFAVLYGRRRVGKTALISEFIHGKKAIYFMGVESNEKQNLENFSQSIMEYSSGNIMQTSFLSLQVALEYVFELAQNEKLILAIDEYPYIARSSKSIVESTFSGFPSFTATRKRGLAPNISNSLSSDASFVATNWSTSSFFPSVASMANTLSVTSLLSG